MKYLTADEARDLAKLNSEECQLVQNILKEIEKAAQKGQYSTSYYTVDYFTTISVGQELAKLGYKTRKDEDIADGYVLHIFW